MEISKILKDLLFEHECVIIPEFGGFITRNESAQFDRVNYTFTPPRKVISFNPMLKHDDGLIISVIAQKNELDYSEAKKILSTWVEDIKIKLQQNQSFHFSSLGQLKAERGILEFTPHHRLNLNKECYGLASFEMQRLIKAPVETPQKVSVYKEWQSYAAAIVFALGIGATGFYANQSVFNSQLSSFFPISVSSAQQDMPAVSTKNKVIENYEISKGLENSTENQANEIDEEKEDTPSIEIKPYQVIGGSYKKYHQAMEREAYMRTHGYPEAVIIGNVNNFTMVAYQTFDNREDALKLKREIERKGKDVFLREE
ncbi:SPOR domain-containing protein [Candidatus Ornithobacterium hominis]|uniref:HU domain-containing protein n=1 Tax=Candidatus Ornithobacterium hominis TaxID=2497989 RepID=UPI0024BCBF8A|nr:hypothetical protein [Candidatus Ornithobacterium hominis]CAI9430061.1 SPOR domain-containing protein [Candidatus Ornithobacterium hominis]